MHKRIDIVSVCYWICVSTNGHTYLPITWNMIIWETKEQVKLITKFSLVVMCSSFYVYCALRATILTTALFQLKCVVCGESIFSPLWHNPAHIFSGSSPPQWMTSFVRLWVAPLSDLRVCPSWIVSRKSCSNHRSARAANGIWGDPGWV